MNQIYLNCPSVGPAMSAEEFAAQNGGPNFGPALGGLQSQNDCCCENGGQAPECPKPGCCQPGGQMPFCNCGQAPAGCCQPMVCCCRPVQPPCKPVEVEEDACCCKQSFRAALQLLCNPCLSGLLDFSAVAFITDDYLAGSVPETPATPTAGTPSDNLADELTGTFRRFSPCNADLLDITAPVYSTSATADTAVLTATQMSLCALDALAIQAAPAEAEGDLSEEEVAARNFRTIQSILTQGSTQGACAMTPGCNCCDGGGEGCCCSKGVLTALSQGNLSRQVSLVAGPLVLNEATLLGNVGNVLILANPEDQRIYFVCANSVQFIA